MSKLSELSIIAWIDENKIKNEKGDRIDFKDHLFIYDIYRDTAKDLVVMKPAQVGMSTCEILRNHFAAKNQKMDIIYTLPTDADVKVFVGGKVNRIIASNPCMLKDVADKDSIEQKQVGSSMIYFRGTWSRKAAIMVTADRLAHDEKDSSKLDVVADYKARLQHSKFKQVHTFSHPSLPETGVHSDWLKSDQKYWFIKCTACNFWGYLDWNIDDPNKMSIDIERRIFICKRCGAPISDRQRALGQWVAKYPSKEISGYWISLLMASWMSAGVIIDKFQDPDMTPDFFSTKVLGLPYADGSSKLLRKHFEQNLTGKTWAPTADQRVIIGIDTGLKLDYVLGGKYGIFYYGDTDQWRDMDDLMRRWPKAIAIVDQGGDILGTRAFRERWPGRVFLCMLGGDRKTKELVKWGTKDEHGACVADRNRMIQLTIDEFRNKRIPVHGTMNDWNLYYMDWGRLSKIKTIDPDTNEVKGYKFVRTGRDHLAMATVFWRIGMSKFAGMGKIVTPTLTPQPNSYYIDPDGTVSFDPKKLLGGLANEISEGDWRNI